MVGLIERIRRTGGRIGATEDVTRKPGGRPAKRPVLGHIKRGFPKLEEARELHTRMMTSQIMEQQLGIEYLREYIKKPKDETFRERLENFCKGLGQRKYWEGHFIAFDRIFWSPLATIRGRIGRSRVNLQKVLEKEERRLNEMKGQLSTFEEKREITVKKGKKEEVVKFDVLYFGRLFDLQRGSGGKLKADIREYLEEIGGQA